MHNGKIAVIGDKDSVIAFKAVGIEVFEAVSDEQTREQLKKLAKNDYSLILITEDRALSVRELILEYKAQSYPIILPIPSGSGTTGFGMQGLKYNIEKAIGMDIVFRDEGK